MAKKNEQQKDIPVTADPEIDRVAGALALPEGEDDAEVLEAPPEEETVPVLPVKTRKAKKAHAFSHVVTDWAGQVNHDGRKFYAGDGIDLSPEEAAALGKAVEPAEPAS